MKWTIIATALFFLFLGSVSCRQLKEPEFRKIEKMGVKKVDFQEATVGFSVTYYNPNNFGVTVREAEAAVYLDSNYLGKFVQDSAVSVNRNADFSIPFSGKISLQDALHMNLQDLSQRDVFVKADGSVKVGKAGIYISRPIHYEGVHRLDEIRLP